MTPTTNTCPSLAMWRSVGTHSSLLSQVGASSDVDALLVEGGPGQGHVGLPADERADPHAADVDDGEHRPLAVRPHEPLGSGGDQLAVEAGDLPGVVDVDHRVVEGARARPLGDPERHPGAGRLGGGRTRRGAGPGTSTAWSWNRAYHSASLHGLWRHTQSG